MESPLHAVKVPAGRDERCNAQVTDRTDDLRLRGNIMRTSLRCVTACCWPLLLASLAVAHSAPGAGSTDNWVTNGGDTDETHYSRLDQIKATNIEHLGLAWWMDVPGEAALAGIPLEIDGTLYFTGDHAIIYAVNAASGLLRWKFDPKLWEYHPAAVAWHFSLNHGAAYADGRLFVLAMDGRLFAVNAKTGEELWHVDTLAENDRRQMHGAPRVFGDKVIIGNGGADSGARGYVTAYEAATGKQAWRFYVTPGSPEENRGDPAMERAAATWGTAEYWKTGTGGGPWDSIVFDAALRQIYLGTGNPAGAPPDVRSPGGGDNLYTSAIVALNADTGKYVWHYQVNPRDAWDYDDTEQITLADLNIDGHRRPVLLQAPKNGFFYVIDRKTGKLVSAQKFAKVTWAERIDLKTGRPVEVEHIREHAADLWPSPNGAHSWQAMSFSPKTGYAYIPTMQMGVHFDRAGGMGAHIVQADERDSKGALLAWDVVRQKQAWYVQHDQYFNGGTLATAGNLVFQGTADGYLSAYAAASGERVWHFYVGMGIISAPISYAVGGKQYISVLSGYGASAGASGPARVGWRFSDARRLLTFALDAKATLPSVSHPDLSVRAVDDPSIQIDPESAAAGARVYNRCRNCHGGDMASSGSAPDLRESSLALSKETLWSVVHGGALIQQGMPRFDDLTQQQVDQLYAYIRAGARKALTGSTPP
jgi:quinohemoprotein ethanol dehydrogenase